MGTRTNITFLGAGPTKNPLFQRPLPGLERAGVEQLGSRDALISATEDAMGFATANKLNDIQLKILTENLSGINKILNPPPLPMATMTNVTKFPGTGITSIRRSPKRAQEITDDMAMIEDPASIPRSRLPEPGPGELEAFKESMNFQTGVSRAIARQILTKDPRLKLKPEELYALRVEGSRGPDPLDLMRKYYGESMLKYDDFLNQVDITAAAPAEFAEMILKHVNLVPKFAEGGLARILEV
jgi:hypothetical protein